MTRGQHDKIGLGKKNKKIMGTIIEPRTSFTSVSNSYSVLLVDGHILLSLQTPCSF